MSLGSPSGEASYGGDSLTESPHDDSQADSQAESQSQASASEAPFAEAPLPAEAPSAAAAVFEAVRRPSDVVYSGYILNGLLSFRHRDLPKNWRCGVCQALSKNDACESCKSDRVAPWQMRKKEVLQPGSILEARAPEAPFEVAIVTAILRTQQKVQLVAFQPTAENPFFPLNMSKSDLDAYDVRHPSHRRSNDFTDMALCRKCECVFRVRNGRVSAQMRRELGGELQTLESDVLEASRHKKTLMEKTPNAFGAILEANRAVGDFEAKVACAKTRLEKPQVWCPGCLNTDFPLN